MSHWSFDELRAATRGKWLAKPVDRRPDIVGIGTDSREDLKGKAFVALRGEYFDGHAFLHDAISGEATTLIIDSTDALIEPVRLAIEHAGVGVLRVRDTLESLAKLAQAHRNSFTGEVIGVTGSAGKTTTVRLIDAALSESLKGSASRKSFNNHIGVPLTLLGSEANDDYVVCEIGMSAPG
ncbi:MAG: Mur ligase family protein, partial [Planctomycetota bacterium]